MRCVGLATMFRGCSSPANLAMAPVEDSGIPDSSPPGPPDSGFRRQGSFGRPFLVVERRRGAPERRKILHTLPSSTHTHRPILVTRPRDSREDRDSLRQATPGRYRRGARSARAPRTARFTFILNKGAFLKKKIELRSSCIFATRCVLHPPCSSPRSLTRQRATPV